MRKTLKLFAGLSATNWRIEFVIHSALFISFVALFIVSGCRRAEDRFVLALEARPETLDPLRSTDAASERLRQLMFNTLVRKNERFEYVGELAETIEPSSDALAYTFKLRDGVRFHDGRPLTATDAKYTLDALLASDSRKAAPFFEGAGSNRQPRISSIEAPDARTLVVRLSKPWPELLANLVPIGIIRKEAPNNSERNRWEAARSDSNAMTNRNKWWTSRRTRTTGKAPQRSRVCACA